MRCFTYCACLAALALMAAGARAETYTIKLKDSADVGKSMVVKDTDTKTELTKVRDADGNLVKDVKHTETTNEEYTETVLAKEGRLPTRYKRTYDKATRTLEGKTTPLSYEGRTILFEKKDDKFLVRPEGDKPVDRKDLEQLTRKANQREDHLVDVLLPRKPVAVEDTWKIDGKDFATGPGLDPATSGGEAKLVKVYKKGDSLYGQIVITLKVGFKPAKDAKFEKAPVLETKLTLDTAIDGSSTAGTLKSSGGVGYVLIDERGGKKMKIESRQELSGKTEQSAEK